VIASPPSVRTRATSVLLCSVWLAAAAAAEPPTTEDLPPVRISAYRIPLLLKELTSSVEVIGRRTLDRRQPLTAADALRAVPGLHVDQLGGPGGAANVYIRGAEPNHTLVLVDGVRVNDLNDARGGGYDFSSVAVEDIERIEVLRGAHSASFGADAMGGVINIVTKRGGESAVSARVAAGGQGLRQASAAVSNRWLAASANRLDDGTAAARSWRLIESASANVTLAQSSLLSARLGLRSRSRRSDSFPEASGGIRLAEIRELEHRKWREDGVQLDTDLSPDEHVHFNLELSRLRKDEAVTSPGVAPGPGGEVPASETNSRLRRDGAALTGRFDGLPLAGVVTAGVEVLRESGDVQSEIPAFGPQPISFALQRRTRSIFGELRVEPAPRLLAVLSLRHDAVSALDGVTSRSAGLRWRIDETGPTLRANWGEGFKPPSFFALGQPLVGNPGLVPETNRSRELGVDFEVSAVALRTTVFDNRYKNLIDFDPETFRLVNRQSVSARGVETQIAFAPTGNISVQAASAWVRHRSAQASPLRNRPMQRTSLSIQWQIDDSLDVHASWLHVGSTRDFSVPTGEVSLTAHDRLDMALAMRLNEHFSLDIALDNLLDRRAESYVGFTQPGRRARLALRGRF
jgi:vitamin B12 transporter